MHRFLLQQNNRITRLQHTFLEDPQIQARSSTIQKPLDNVVALKFRRELETWQPWLAHGKDGRADAKLIADTDALFGQSRNGEVLAKCAPIQTAERWLPK